MISFEDFSKVEIKVGTIVAAAPHPNADKLMVLQVSLGTETRQIVAGIRLHYTPEQLITRQIAIITNLEPIELRGVTSNGMVLAAKDSTGLLALLTPDKPVEPGCQAK